MLTYINIIRKKIKKY